MESGSVLIVCVVILIVVAGLLTVYFQRQRAAFAKKAATTDAEITNLRTKSRGAGFLGYSPTYYVDYTYFAGLSPEYKVRQGGSHEVSEGTYAQLEVGKTIQINYLPDSPGVSLPVASYLDPGIERRNLLSCFTYAVSVGVTLLIAYAILLSRQANSPSNVGQVSAAQHADLAEIHAALDSRIPAWQAGNNSQQVRLSATDAGFSSTEMREVYYGKCQAKGSIYFYIYIMHFISTSATPDTDWLADAYTYTPGLAKVTDCLPEGWSAVSDKPIDGDWHDVFFTYPAQIPFYKLTATAQAKGAR